MCLVSLGFSESEQATQSEKKQDYAIAIAISKLKLHTNAAENNSKEIFYAKKRRNSPFDSNHKNNHFNNNN